MRILIACGGTAGHIFPGLALAEELKREDNRSQIVIVVSTHPRDRTYLKAAGSFLKEMHIETIGTMPLPYKFSPKFVLFVVRLFWAFLKSFIIILRCAPQVVVGFGGYASFAPLIIARIMGLTVIIHEQNLVPGKANRLLSRIADRIAVTFDDTNKFFHQGAKSYCRIVKTGLPLRKQFLDYKRDSQNTFTQPLRSRRAGLETVTKRFTILVVGGSQGAHNINELVLNCLDRMDEEGRMQMHLIHLTGSRDFHHVKARYESLGVAWQVFDFVEDMASVYRIADLLISRSGASTIFEAATFGLPCILIPHSCATTRQKENALLLRGLGAALVLDEETSSGENLRAMLQKLLGNETLRQNLSQKIKVLENPGATHNLKEQIDALYRARYVCE